MQEVWGQNSVLSFPAGRKRISELPAKNRSMKKQAVWNRSRLSVFVRRNCDMALVFEHVKESEADEVLTLYRSLVGTPFCAWTADYPARSDVEFDLSRNALFCLRDEENGEIAGVISIDQDPKVESLTCWTPELQPGRELSRLGVREAYQNQGIARRLMTGAMEELRRQGFKSVHILVAKENKKALASYKVFEYETVGACFLHEHDYWCYEKAL
ncbi:GNAT family N-acetyltransferase [Clostridium sp. AF27-2AA]|jgi:ribosomal protein S18 acetylase RimI-like enzyme|nr:GNAT family N-acetyltransferase [Clostridium sp. AF27-2AA]